MATEDIITEVLGGVLPSLATLKMIGIVILIFCVMIVVAIVLLGKWKRPIKYKADIFRKAGDKYVIDENVIIVYKRTALDQGYYIEKRKINLEVGQGFLTKKAKTKFYLMRIEDRYIPIKLEDFVNMIKKGNKKGDKIKAGKFLAESKIDEYEKAITESVKLDAKKYRWVDKLGPLLQVGVPMIVLLIAFFLVAWSARGSAAVVNSMEGLTVEFGKNVQAFSRVATAMEAFATQCGGSVVPPPG